MDDQGAHVLADIEDDPPLPVLARCRGGHLVISSAFPGALDARGHGGTVHRRALCERGRPGRLGGVVAVLGRPR